MIKEYACNSIPRTMVRSLPYYRGLYRVYIMCATPVTNSLMNTSYFSENQLRFASQRAQKHSTVLKASRNAICVNLFLGIQSNVVNTCSTLWFCHTYLVFLRPSSEEQSCTKLKSYSEPTKTIKLLFILRLIFTKKNFLRLQFSILTIFYSVECVVTTLGRFGRKHIFFW